MPSSDSNKQDVEQGRIQYTTFRKLLQIQ